MSDPDLASQLAAMEFVWDSIGELLPALSPKDWDRPTDCPGWTVKDVVSHMAGNESTLAGRPRPTVEEFPREHLRNELGEWNEVEVQARRPWSAEQVLADWRDITAQRCTEMGAWADADWDRVLRSPLGEMPARAVMQFRVFDSWVHEQDIRRATGRPGGLTGLGAAHAYGMFRRGMGFAVGKKAGAPEGSSVAFDLRDAPGEPFAVGVKDGRGVEVERPAEPTAALECDFETYGALCAGRWTASRARDDKRLEIVGDEGLGMRVAGNLNVVP